MWPDSRHHQYHHLQVTSSDFIKNPLCCFGKQNNSHQPVWYISVAFQIELTLVLFGPGLKNHNAFVFIFWEASVVENRGSQWPFFEAQEQFWADFLSDKICEFYWIEALALKPLQVAMPKQLW